MAVQVVLADAGSQVDMPLMKTERSKGQSHAISVIL